MITAVFQTDVQYTVTVQSEDTNKGTVSGGGACYAGDGVSVSASPKQGWGFDGWYLNGSKISGSASFIYSPSASCTLIAKFQLISTLTGPTTVCSCSSEEFIINNLPANATVNWTVGSGNNFSITPGTGANNYKATVAVGSGLTGEGTIIATINGNVVIQNSFTVNFPKPTSQTINLSKGQIYSWNLPANPDITGYTWSLTAPPNPTGAYINGQNTHADVSFNTAGVYTLFAYGKNKCGASSNPSPIFIYNFVVGSNSMTSVYPNPASDVLNIEINESSAAPIYLATQSIQSVAGSTNSSTNGTTYDIRLYNAHGKLMRHKKEKAGKVQLNVSHLHNGNYYLHIYDDVSENPEVHQIIVKR